MTLDWLWYVFVSALVASSLTIWVLQGRWRGRLAQQQLQLEQQQATHQQTLAHCQATHQQELEQLSERHALALEHAQQLGQSLQAQLSETQTNHRQIQTELTACQTENARLQERLTQVSQQLEQAEQHWKAQWEKDFQQFLSRTLEANRQQWEDRAKQELAERQQQMEVRMKQLAEPLDKLILNYRNELVELSKEHLGRVRVLDEKINTLAHSNQQLVSVLKTNKGVGSWGELELLRLLEFAGLRAGVDYELQPTERGNQRPDVKVWLPEKGVIYIDAKTLQVSTVDWEAAQQRQPAVDTAPQDGCSPGMASSTVAPAVDAAEARRRMGKSLREAIRLLGSKAYHQALAESPDFVVLFVPRESMLALAFEEDPHLWEEALAHNVLLASPLHLIGLLRIVRFGWQQKQLGDQVYQVQVVGKELHEKLVLFCERMGEMEQRLAQLNTAYEKAAKTLQGRGGLVSKASKLAELGCEGKKSLSAELRELALLQGEVTEAVEV